MGSSGKARGLLGLLLLFGAIGVASAQSAPATPTPASTPPVELGAGQDVALSADAMAGMAKGFLPEMDRGAAVVRRLLAEAREKRDVVRVLCLNDKLNQVDLATRTASDRVDAVSAAAQAKDLDRTKHEFTVASVLRDRVRTLVSEANQCIGEETGFVGESKVTVDIDPNLPDEDPDFPDDPLVSVPPVLSSPTL
jgi:hypothetical protein